MAEFVSLEIEAGVATLRLDRPKMNALNQQVQDHAAKRPVTKALICSEGLPALRLHTQGGDFFPETYFARRGDVNAKENVRGEFSW